MLIVQNVKIMLRETDPKLFGALQYAYALTAMKNQNYSYMFLTFLNSQNQKESA